MWNLRTKTSKGKKTNQETLLTVKNEQVVTRGEMGEIGDGD